MDKNKVAERDGKARSAFNVSECHTFIDSQYDIVLGKPIGETGPLVVAKLEAKDAPPKAAFILRWDEKANCLDVEPPANATRKQKQLFRNGTNGYSGHHPEKIGSGPRVFEVDIVWNCKGLYHGEIGFSLGREVEAKVSIGLCVSAHNGVTKLADHQIAVSKR